jgi:hypothetical protein
MILAVVFLEKRIGRPRSRISKLDAAERQIDTAIRLYFEDGDLVSIHKLSAAALRF